MPKKSPLVSQHLEHIKFNALEDYQQIIRTYIRRREGVYALYRKGTLYYVGLASDLKWRLGNHLKDRHKEKWDAFSVYLTVNAEHLKELESLMLRVIKPMPKGNK
jgi:Uri superfamily endonuclease